MTFADVSPSHPFLMAKIIAQRYAVPQTTTAANQNRINPILIKISIIAPLPFRDLERGAATFLQAPTNSLC